MNFVERYVYVRACVLELAVKFFEGLSKKTFFGRENFKDSMVGN